MHELVRKLSPVSCHGIHASNGTQCNGVVKGTLITHDTYGTVSQKDCACLPYLVIETPLAQAVYEYGIGLLEYGHLMGSNLTDYSNCQTGTRERMTAYEVLGNTKTTADGTDLILEEPLERLAELETHLLGQTAYVMMALDCLTGYVEALNTVRIDGTLGEPLGIGYLGGLGIEHLNKVAAYDLTFLLRIGHTLQVLKELGRCIHTLDIQAQAHVVTHHVGELVLTQQSVVYEYTGQVLTDSLVEQYGSNG